MRPFRILARAVLVIITAFGLAACRHLPAQPGQLDNQPSQNVQSNSTMPRRIEFTTQDGVTIVADWYPVSGATKTTLLVHMLPATKESYVVLAKKLNAAGISALAIDLRGHGDSVNGPAGRLNYQDFSSAQHLASIADLDAALDWFNQQGFSADKISVIGASIGANLSLQAAADHPEIMKIVLLSPGLDYHGVQTEPFITKLSETVQVLLISSEGDGYSADSVRRLKELRPVSQLKLLPGSAHGTDLFQEVPSLPDEITQFISD